MALFQFTQSCGSCVFFHFKVCKAHHVLMSVPWKPLFSQLEACGKTSLNGFRYVSVPLEMCFHRNGRPCCLRSSSVCHVFQKKKYRTWVCPKFHGVYLQTGRKWRRTSENPGPGAPFSMALLNTPGTEIPSPSCEERKMSIEDPASGEQCEN